MSNCWRRLINHSILRNLTDSIPFLPSERRWFKILHMLKRFIQIPDVLLAVTEKDSATVTIYKSHIFMERTRTIVVVMSEIDTVTLDFQRWSATILDCRFSEHTLIDSIIECPSDVLSAFSGCRMAFSIEWAACKSLEFLEVNYFETIINIGMALAENSSPETSSCWTKFLLIEIVLSYWYPKRRWSVCLQRYVIR